MIVGFAYNKESVPARFVGTASGVCNMGPLMGGMILQPVVGWVLDRRGDPRATDGRSDNPDWQPQPPPPRLRRPRRRAWPTP